MRRAEIVPNSRSSRAVSWNPDGGLAEVDAQQGRFVSRRRKRGADQRREILRRGRLVSLEGPLVASGSRRGTDVTSFVHRRAADMRARTEGEKSAEIRAHRNFEMHGEELLQEEMHFPERQAREMSLLQGNETEEERFTISFDELNGIDPSTNNNNNILPQDSRGPMFESLQREADIRSHFQPRRVQQHESEEPPFKFPAIISQGETDPEENGEFEAPKNQEQGEEVECVVSEGHDCEGGQDSLHVAPGLIATERLVDRRLIFG